MRSLWLLQAQVISYTLRAADMHIAARGGAADGCVVHATSWKGGAVPPRPALDLWRAVVPGHTKPLAPIVGDPERLHAQARRL